MALGNWRCGRDIGRRNGIGRGHRRRHGLGCRNAGRALGRRFRRQPKRSGANYLAPAAAQFKEDVQDVRIYRLQRCQVQEAPVVAARDADVEATEHRCYLQTRHFEHIGVCQLCLDFRQVRRSQVNQLNIRRKLLAPNSAARDWLPSANSISARRIRPMVNRLLSIRTGLFL